MSTQLPVFSIDEFTTFLLNATLYQKLHVILNLALPYRFQGFLPERIYFDCEHCSRNQAFVSLNSRYLDTEPDELESEVEENSLRLMVAQQVAGGSAVVDMINTRALGFYQLHYACGICHQSHLRWFLEIGRDEQGMFIRKVGQEPAYDIGISREVKKHLTEEETRHYKHAKICISQLYGIGACIYLRRLVEDQINPLLENYLAKRQSEGADETEVEQIRHIIGERVMEKKIRLVTTPHAATGLNPVGRMYDKLSTGIHTFDDETCTEIAKDVLTAFDEILIGLKRRIDEEAAYKERMRVLAEPVPARKAKEIQKQDS
jgi:hypothetical protein